MCKLWWVVSISLCVLDDLLPMRFPCFLLALFSLLLAPATFGSSSSIHPEGGHLDVLQRLDSAACPQHLRVFSVNKHSACGNGCLQKSAIVMRIGLQIEFNRICGINCLYTAGTLLHRLHHVSLRQDFKHDMDTIRAHILTVYSMMRTMKRIVYKYLVSAKWRWYRRSPDDWHGVTTNQQCSRTQGLEE